MTLSTTTKKDLNRSLARAMRDRAKDSEILNRVPSDPALHAVWTAARAEAHASREHDESKKSSIRAGVKVARAMLAELA